MNATRARRLNSASRNRRKFEPLERREMFTVEPLPGSIPFDEETDPVECSALNGGVCQADADGDDVVSFADFLILSDNYGKQNATHADGDFDGDGVVGFEDFLILFGEFGS